MEITDSGEFQRRLLAVSELFDKGLSPAQQALYFDALRDLPFADVARALRQATKVCTFMPKPAELRTIAVGDTDDHAERAWIGFRAAASRIGAWASLITRDPVLGETILAVFRGWPEACALELSPEMWSSKRKEFGRVYRVIAARGLSGGRYLAGICEQQNAGKAEWSRYIAAGVVETDGTTRSLSAGEADEARQHLAATTATGLTPLIAAAAKALPAQKSESA